MKYMINIFFPGEHVYELSMYLYLLNNTCFPRWPQIYAIADHAMGRLADIDAEFYEHIKAICQRNPRVNPKVNIFYTGLNVLFNKIQ